IGTPPGTYVLTLNGGGAGQTNSTTASFIVTTNLPGAMLWTQASGTDTNWSTGLNWTNLTSGGNGPPSAVSDVIFAAAGASTLAASVSNTVNSAATINSLWYKNGSGNNTNHTTRINPGVTLTVAGTTNITGGTGFTSGNFNLLVGTNGSVTPSLNVT